MNDKEAEDLMKKHPPWFLFDFHPIRFVKRLSEEEQKDKKEGDERTDDRKI